MTESKPFAAVIETLQSERDRYFLPTELPERQQIEAAIRVLENFPEREERRVAQDELLVIQHELLEKWNPLIEAAGNLTREDREWLEHRVDLAIAEYVPAIEGMVCPGAAMKDRFRALLAALPDKDVTGKEK